MYDVSKIIFLHWKRMGSHGDFRDVFMNCLEFARLVGIIENNNTLYGKNPTSSAKGLYQFISGSIKPAVNRTRRYLGERNWYEELLEHKDASRVGWEEQTILFFANILGQRGSDEYMKHIMESGSKLHMELCYYKFHHTAPDEATILRVKKIIY
jgi:hypothetical protein